MEQPLKNSNALLGRIQIIEGGLLTTIQDLGRPGFGDAGVSPGGAADPLSLRLGNKILKNPQNSSAIEMTLFGGTFEFHGDTFAVLAGADFQAQLNGKSVSPNSIFEVKKGDVLQCKTCLNGIRGYLCVKGGFEVPLFLESASTHVSARLGGFNGRPLRQGDILHIDRSVRLPFELDLQRNYRPNWLVHKNLRATLGLNFKDLKAKTQKALFTETFEIAAAIDRLGIRLHSSWLTAADYAGKEDSPSIGVSVGTVQMTPSGQMNILFVEQQTTGGYPQIFSIIAADLHRLSQMRPGEKFNFENVSYADAKAALLEQEKIFDELFI